MLSGKDVNINGDSETSRDFCYVENTVQMNLLPATTENSQVHVQVYNTVLNDQTNLNQLFQIIQHHLVERVAGLEKKHRVMEIFWQVTYATHKPILVKLSAY